MSNEFYGDGEPEYPSPAETGDTVLVTGSLATLNSTGGTATLKHEGVMCVVTKAFWDYETGWRFHGRVVDDQIVELFKEQATSQFTPEHYREKFPDKPHLYESAVAAGKKFDPGYVYFSEHALDKNLTPVQGLPKI